MTLKDWIEVIDDDIDEAVDELNGAGIDRLVEYLRKKIDEIDLPF